MVNVYLSVLNRIILHRAFRHFQCFLKFFRRTKSEKGYLTTTYRFLKTLFAVQIYRSTSDCSLANISDIASRRYRFQLCVNRAYFTDGVTAAYPSTRLRYSIEQRFRPPRFLELCLVLALSVKWKDIKISLIVKRTDSNNRVMKH